MCNAVFIFLYVEFFVAKVAHNCNQLPERVIEVVTRGVKEGLPWELLYADELVLVAQSKEELREKVMRWKECMELKGLKVNIEKTKVMRGGKSGGEIVKTGR